MVRSTGGLFPLLLLSRPLSGSQCSWLELGAQWTEKDEEGGRSSLSGEWNVLTNPGLGQGFAQNAYGCMCVRVRACVCVRAAICQSTSRQTM